MKENAGSKIKKFIGIITNIEICFNFLLCFLLIVLGVLIDNKYSFCFIIVGVVLALSGLFFIWFKNIFLQAYGELVENSAECSEHLKDIKKLLENAKVDEPTKPNVPDFET